MVMVIVLVYLYSQSNVLVLLKINELTHLLFPHQGTGSIPITVWHIESIIGVVEAHAHMPTTQPLT